MPDAQIVPPRRARSVRIDLYTCWEFGSTSRETHNKRLLRSRLQLREAIASQLVFDDQGMSNAALGLSCASRGLS
jgi:hypothetical protein